MKTDPSASANVLPPWRAFPDVPPIEVLTATQGVQELWLDQVWRPFWTSMTPEQRNDYLDRWNATREWRDTLEHFPARDFDPDQDAADSESHLQAQQRTRPRKISLLSRLWRFAKRL